MSDGSPLDLLPGLYVILLAVGLAALAVAAAAVWWVPLPSRE